MGNGSSRPLMTQDPGTNIRRNEKLTKDASNDKVPFGDALQKDKNWKVLSKKDCRVAKLNLAGVNRIRYSSLPSALEPEEQEHISEQKWEMSNPAFVEEKNS